jgi:hypothetical protein
MSNNGNVEVLKEWAGENLTDEDKGALAELATDLPTAESDLAWQDPAVRKAVNDAGEAAVKGALETAQSETVDKMNDHWTANPDSHTR